jgi:hypothetical protein
MIAATTADEIGRQIEKQHPVEIVHRHIGRMTATLSAVAILIQHAEPQNDNLRGIREMSNHPYHMRVER